MTTSLSNSIILPQIISASRRTDMIASDPANLVARLEEKAPPTTTHTIVLWTKNPQNILSNKALRNRLLQYEQLFLHLSITGLGGTSLEPRVPKPNSVLSLLPSLINFVQGPERISIRFDPIVHFKMPDGSFICNLSFFEKLAPTLAQHKLHHVVTSWVQIYGKVSRRLQKLGIRPVSLTDDKRQKETVWLQNRAREHGIELRGCCVPGWTKFRCIDAGRLNQLHPRGRVADSRKAGGQRPLCGCSKSLDIGWYSLCIHGCIYCYGNPQICNLTNKESIEHECF